MEDLLYLVHRIPYPPNKGDKIRSYHLLKHLSRRYRIFLGTFIDDPADWQHVETVKSLCAETCIVNLHPLAGKLASLRGLASGMPLTLPYYHSARLQSWVDILLASRRIKHAFVFSSAMAQYLHGRKIARRVIDFVDVDSEKWRQYGNAKRWPLNQIYHREARLLLDYERRIASEFDHATFVSGAEARLFKRLAPEAAGKIRFFNNGVDADYFTPQAEYANPFPSGVRPLVFTGAMDYWANAEAVEWFAHKIFPVVRARQPSAVFYIVGARPTPAVRALGTMEGVTVTGSVPDVRPFLAHAALSVAPLRIARGIQNKVLEAMSMAKTVIASPEAAEGIHAIAGRELLVARDERGFVDLIVSHLRSGALSYVGAAARERVMRHYSWQSGMQQLDALLDPATADQQPLDFGSARRMAGSTGRGLP